MPIGRGGITRIGPVGPILAKQRAADTSVGGMSLIAATAVVLISDTSGFPRPPDTTQALHAFRGATAAQAQPQRLEFWQPSTRLPEADFEARRADHTLLHRYRQSFQTVGQPWLALQTPSPPRLEPEPYTVKSAPPTLHLYRTGFQTVGQPWALTYAYQPPRFEPEPVRQPADYSALLFNRTALATVQQTPWWMYYPPAQVRIEAEGFRIPAADYSSFFNRTPQSGMSMQTASQLVLISDTSGFPRAADTTQALFSFTLTAPAVATYQPWNLYAWQGPLPDTSADQHYEYRSRDFWSDLFPFLITPTTPVTPVEPDLHLGPMGPLYPSGIASHVSHQIDKLKGARKRKPYVEPESEPLTTTTVAHSKTAPVTLADAIDPESLKKLQHLAEQLRSTKGLILTLGEELTSQRQIEDVIALLLLLML
jgi:hypothetical protein